MMKLYERLPDSLEVEGLLYPIETDFRYWAKFEQLISNPEGSAEELTALIALLFYEDLPTNLPLAFQQLLWFCRLGEEVEEPTVETQGSRETSPRAYDLDVDAGAIYSLFWWEGGLDLFELSDFHWWKFKRLLLTAPQETTFGKLVEIRTKDTSDMEKKEKKHWNELKRKFSLEKEEQFASAKEMKDAYAEKLRKRMEEASLS